MIGVLLGLTIGSFLNVVIARLPEHRGLGGRSACPQCGAPIAWYDNVPLLSFVALRGRCRRCRAGIPWRYPIVEALTAVLFGFAFTRFVEPLELVSVAIFISALIAITGIDLAHQIIPDVISLPGIALGFLASLATRRVDWIESLIGIVIGGGIFWIIIRASVLVLGREGMGGGDVKLGAMLGAFLGWKVVLVAIFVAVVGGGIVATALLALDLTRRKDPIPFGPFLALGGIVGLFWGDRLLAWYMRGFTF
jgi:leader peptidase (prepilin peptidase)/N-methyltransferase